MKTEQKWEIGDCLQLLPKIPDKSIDMILTDLPYGTTQNNWDAIISPEKLWVQYERIIKDRGGNLIIWAG
jgi:site-specific DNA-methyltransferase (adenine-specific)